MLTDHKFVVIWELIFSILCCWNMLTVPLMLAFPKVYERIPNKYAGVEISLELMWVISIIQKCLTAEPPRTVTFRAIVAEYARSGMLFIDVIANAAVLSLLLAGRKDVSPFFGLLRFFHWQAMFYPFQFYFDHYSKATKVKKKGIMGVIQVFVFILILDHFLACMWIILGGRDPEGESTWLFANGMPPKDEKPFQIWATAFYWVFEVLSTVGYGDFGYGSTVEYWFTIMLEFMGVIFNAVLIGTVTGVTKGDLNFD